jgi:hypothetical protein
VSSHNTEIVCRIASSYSTYSNRDEPVTMG